MNPGKFFGGTNFRKRSTGFVIHQRRGGGKLINTARRTRELYGKKGQKVI